MPLRSQIVPAHSARAKPRARALSRRPLRTRNNLGAGMGAVEMTTPSQRVANTQKKGKKLKNTQLWPTHLPVQKSHRMMTQALLVVMGEHPTTSSSSPPRIIRGRDMQYIPHGSSPARGTIKQKGTDRLKGTPEQRAAEATPATTAYDS